MVGGVEETDQIVIVDRHRLRIRQRVHEQTLADERVVDEDGHRVVGVVDDGERCDAARFESKRVMQLFGVRETQSPAAQDACELLEIGAFALVEHGEIVVVARVAQQQVLDADAIDERFDELCGLDRRHRIMLDLVGVDVQGGERVIQRLHTADATPRPLTRPLSGLVRRCG